MRFKFLFIFFAFSFSFFALPAQAEINEDKIAELYKKIEELTKQAEQYRGNVLQKQKEADTLKRQIDILNNQIWRLESEIGITERRIETSKIEITNLEGEIFSTQKNIDFQKSAIAETMNYWYQRDQLNVVSSLLKNASLADFAGQANQVATLQDKLNALVKSLKEQKISLEEKKTEQEKKKRELEALNQQQAGQRTALAGTKSSKSKVLADTKGQEKLYQKLLSETEKQTAAFFAELQSMEHEAVANGTVITHVTATAVPARGTKIFKAPYPAGYYQTQGYGMTSYAKRGAYGGAIHNGIDIVDGFGSSIHPIGSGTVLASGFNKGFGNWVAIQHEAGGGMVSVYGHMMQGTSVRIGTTVTTDSTIGFEGSTGTSTGSHLHLSLYKVFFTYINPKNNQLYFNYADGSVNPLDYL